MKNYRFLYLLLFVATLMWTCSKKADDYKDYLADGEIIYTGTTGKITIAPGNGRMSLKWKANTDPSITRYVVYYNNRQDSVIVPNNKSLDSIGVVIPNLSESLHTFVILSFDAKGNRSVPVEVANARVYGPIYQSKLLNRGYNASDLGTVNPDGSLKLNFISPDTINTQTEIKYTDAGNIERTVFIKGTENSITLPSVFPGKPIIYRSTYKPVANSLDAYTVSNYETFPRIYSFVLCDKSLFMPVALPGDVYADSNTSWPNLWDGSVGPQDHPKEWHSSEQAMPQVFTIDLGKVYDNLSQFEITGRSGGHNVITFELWGINTANITGASTVVANDANWKSDMQAKGWVLLGDLARDDDGREAYKFNLLPNPPNVRYIRMRVKSVWSRENYSNIGEITFWNKQ
jgi:hypothetical protein